MIAYDIAKLLYHLEFVSIQMKKFPETCSSWSLKLTQRQKLSVFCPEANLEAEIEAGRVNLAKKVTQNQKYHF